MPESLDQWVEESNPVRVIDAFVEQLDLDELGFKMAEPADLGRPGYNPALHLKLYIYGYLNRIQSSRRLERECQRNLEVLWLLGRLAPDHKTIADFRKDNGAAIKKVCARFVELCRRMGLLAKASVALDGSKFNAVNNRDKNFTTGKVEKRRRQLEESVARYLSQLDTADLHEPSESVELKKTYLKEKLEKLKSEMEKLEAIEQQVQGLARPADLAHRSGLSLDGDERARLGRGRLQRADGGGYRASSDRRARGDECRQRYGTSCQHREGSEGRAACRGARSGGRSRLLRWRGDPGAAIELASRVTLPKRMTSGAKSEGRFGKQDFVYLADEDVYRCPAGEKLKYYYTNEEKGQKLHRYWTNACRTCALKAKCTKGPQRRITRWEHEEVLEAVQARLDRNPDAMRTRRETVEHPFGTIKMRMGATHFLMKTLPKVATEMALCVLTYNLTRVLNIVGVENLMEAIKA